MGDFSYGLLICAAEKQWHELARIVTLSEPRRHQNQKPCSGLRNHHFLFSGP